MSTTTTVSFPIRLPAFVRDELKALALECEVSDHYIMRLALRIGLVDLRRLGKDQAHIIKEAADEAGTSFAAWAKSKAQKTAGHTKNPASKTPALNADSDSTSQNRPSTPVANASTVKLPPQHIAPKKTPRKRDGTNG